MRCLKFCECLRVVDQLGRSLDAADLGTRLGDAEQNGLLLRGKSLDGVNEVGNQVCAALVLVQHFRPTRLDLFIGGLECVVTAAAQ